MSTGVSSAVSYAPEGAITAKSSIAERVALMRSCALFAGLSETECGEVASSSRVRTFARDEILFMQGEPVRQMVLLESGSVKHTQTGSSGNEVILRIGGSGDSVCIPNKTACQQHTCTAQAMMECRSLVWDQSKHQALLAQYPQIGSNINQILSKQLDELQERFREVATEKVALRLALALLRLVKQVGKSVQGGVQVSFSREELAQMTGTTLFTVSRQLSRWAEMGLIEPRREAVVVHDAERLVRLCGVGE
jgi:CRP-like cAMP-binding protein